MSHHLPINFLSSLDCNFPGAFAVGSDEWNMKSFQARSADWNACAAAWTTGTKQASAVGCAYNCMYNLSYNNSYISYS